MKEIILTILISACISVCIAPGQKIEPSHSTNVTANANVDVSNGANAAVTTEKDNRSKFPAQMPSAVEFHYVRHNGQMPLTMIDIKNGAIEYENRDFMTSRPVQRKRKISDKEMEALYRVFTDNKFDLIRNDPPVEQANDTANERISVAFGPGNYTQIVFDPVVSPLSGDSLKRFQTIKQAIFKLLDLEASK